MNSLAGHMKIVVFALIVQIASALRIGSIDTLGKSILGATPLAPPPSPSLSSPSPSPSTHAPAARPAVFFPRFVKASAQDPRLAHEDNHELCKVLEDLIAACGAGAESQSADIRSKYCTQPGGDKPRIGEVESLRFRNAASASVAVQGGHELCNLIKQVPGSYCPEAARDRAGEVAEEAHQQCGGFTSQAFTESTLTVITDEDDNDPAIQYAIVDRPAKITYRFTPSGDITLGDKVVLELPGFSGDDGAAVAVEQTADTCGHSTWTGEWNDIAKKLDFTIATDILPANSPCELIVPASEGLSTPEDANEPNQPSWKVEEEPKPVEGETTGGGARPIVQSSSVCEDENDPNCCSAVNCIACDDSNKCTSVPGGRCGWIAPDPATPSARECRTKECSSYNCAQCTEEADCASAGPTVGECRWGNDDVCRDSQTMQHQALEENENFSLSEEERRLQEREEAN